MADAPIQRKISNITAFFMLVVALLIDFTQFLLTLPIVTSLLSELGTFFALITFGIWFPLVGVSYFGGKKVGLRIASIITSAVIELVPIIDGLPAITAGVIGVIISSRLEDSKPEVRGFQNTVSNHVRFSGPQKIPPSANNNEDGTYREAA